MRSRRDRLHASSRPILKTRPRPPPSATRHPGAGRRNPRRHLTPHLHRPEGAHDEEADQRPGRRRHRRAARHGAAHPELRVDHGHKIVYRGDAPVHGKVGLISGGGSGHEPLHGGFVGVGMLDAACAGEVFTSPVPDQMLEATKTVDGGAGVLHIVKNYTGDVMNFEMAAELAAAETGVEVAVGGHRRRRRRPGQPLHRRPARRRRHRAAGEDRRRRRGGGPQPRRGGRGRAQGQRERPQHGRWR